MLHVDEHFHGSQKFVVLVPLVKYNEFFNWICTMYMYVIILFKWNILGFCDIQSSMLWVKKGWKMITVNIPEFESCQFVIPQNGEAYQKKVKQEFKGNPSNHPDDTPASTRQQVM